ncbi:stage III sporulation protein AF [Cohnella caldifontis]|uniref:stage III sporulation protein AF n=1 Tax=Cohnella caldifontis TaxID=3027471 RepID=UPI0023ECB83B|nr:stage III sporulation protein AF [Cohnella sp. YIM B05605]
MEGLSVWLKQVVAVVLLAGIVDLLLPNRTMQRYVRLVAGLFILLAVASPILRWIQGDFSSRLTEGLNDASFRANTASASGELSRIREEGRKWQEKQRDDAASLAAARLEEAIRADLAENEGSKPAEVRVDMGWRTDGTLEVKEVTVNLGGGRDAGNGRKAPEPVAAVKPVEVEPVTVQGVGEDARPVAAEPPEASAAASGATADPRTANRISAWISARYGVPADRVTVQSGASGDSGGTNGEDGR